MKKADIISKIDELIEGPVYLVDIFPGTVPRKPDNRYLEVEECFQHSRVFFSSYIVTAIFGFRHGGRNTRFLKIQM